MRAYRAKALAVRSIARRCQHPLPLTVSNGTAQSQGGGSFQGTVGADGAVVLHDKGNNRYQGSINGTGLLKVGGGTPRCNFEFVWQKR